MSQGLIFSRSLLSHLIKKIQKNEQNVTLNKQEHGVEAAAAFMDVLYCVALKKAVWVLRLQGHLILHRSEPPGVINNAAKPHSCREAQVLQKDTLQQ